MDIKIYHNPSCSKCRQTLQLLTEKSNKTEKPEVIEYLTSPPNKQELNHILSLLALSPRQLMRTNEKAYTEFNLQNPALSDDELITAMIAHPILIQRPIVIANGKAMIGRPPESVLDIL